MKLNFYMPTKVFFGENCLAEQAAQFKQLGTKAFIATGKSSAQNGSLAAVIAALTASNIDYTLFDRISSNPSVTLVREAAQLAREAKADFIIGIGGGSPMDAAKAIAVLTYNEVDDIRLFSGPYDQPVLPVVAVPTTAGTGSEVTQYSILTNEKEETKTSIANEVIFPKLAFLDPEFMADLPQRVTIHTAVDALSHAVEGYLSTKATTISSLVATESMTLLGECLKQLTEPIDQSVRAKLLYASMLGGMVIAHTGTTAVHAMGYSLTYFKGIDHGRANGLLLGEYLAVLAPSHPEKVQEVLRCLGFSQVEEFKNVLDSLLGEKESVTTEELERFSAKAAQAKNLANTLVALNQADLAGIIKRSLA
ncbi:MAG: iron-containing alcohol dehydrogenase family protein [Sporomusaceae bacterium]|nr:iron-containing alcohol dehydrogenase family protein [Sporomusaceae bacterium]